MLHLSDSKFFAVEILTFEIQIWIENGRKKILYENKRRNIIEVNHKDLKNFNSKKQKKKHKE